MHSVIQWDIGCATGKEWTSAAVDAFEELTYMAKWKPVMSKTVGQRTDDGGFVMPNVQLVDTNGPTVVIHCCVVTVYGNGCLWPHLWHHLVNSSTMVARSHKY